jgi:transcriptional regulator with XRE-family HTH domain
MNLGENIKRLRKEKGWSQTQLAKKVGCHLSNITRIETGKYVPALETVTQIAKILDVPIDYLVNSTDGSSEEIRIEDQALSEKIKLLNTLDDEERFVVNKVIDAMLTKKKMLNLLKEEVQTNQV